MGVAGQSRRPLQRAQPDHHLLISSGEEARRRRGAREGLAASARGSKGRALLASVGMSEDTPPRHAATIMVVRDARPRVGAQQAGDEHADEVGPQLLMLRRHGRSGFAGDAWVFPGGVVDEGDRQLAPDRWSGIDPDALADRFDAPPDLVLGFHVAAVRETFEEAGLLLAARVDGCTPDVTAPHLTEVRRRLADRDVDLDWARWLAEEELVLDLGRLTYHSRWVTPARERRRYDTAFFLARAPQGQIAAHDLVETTGQRWITASAALRAHRSGELHLIYPTIKTLEALRGHGDVAALTAAARSQPRIRSIQPHVDTGRDGWRILHPDDPEYPHHLYGQVGP
jgi:8-oxo-dGTP pyrophosphatase MutT (NUDIX family)